MGDPEFEIEEETGGYVRNGDVLEWRWKGMVPPDLSAEPEAEELEELEEPDTGTGPYEGRNMEQLKAVARKQGLEGFSTMDRDELMEALRG